MKHIVIAIGSPLILLTMLLSGCASTANEPTRVQEDFGQSVRQMTNAQIYDPAAARKPLNEPPMGLDGVQGEAVLKTYREDVGNPDAVRDDLKIGVSP